MEIRFASMHVSTQPMHIGIAQGRSESPALFVCALDYVLQPVLQKWERDGLGSKLLGGMTSDVDPDCLRVISHLIYMDDV
eukprot:2546209-Heterocapsa_arctica.AAC.1